MTLFQKPLGSLTPDGTRFSLRGKKKNKQNEASQPRNVDGNSSSGQGKSLPYEIPNCRLFQLPREIRDQIWEYILAQNFIHVGNPSTKKVTHIVCRALISDRLAHAMYPFQEVDEAQWDEYRKKLPSGQAIADYRIKDKRLQYHDFRHSFCFAESWRFAKAINPPYPPKVQEAIRESQLSLTIMRTCRAIYAETLPLLWMHNSFGFAKSVTFEEFVSPRMNAASPRAIIQRTSLRHLAIKPENTVLILTQSESWNRRKVHSTAWSQTLKLLPNLSSVYLTARFDLSWEETEAIWCRGELATPIDPKTSIEIIDDLLDKPALADFCVHIEGIEVWRSRADGGSHTAYGCDELYLDLAELLHRRVMSHGTKTSDKLRDRLELDKQQLEHRRITWENWQMARSP